MKKIIAFVVLTFYVLMDVITFIPRLICVLCKNTVLHYLAVELSFEEAYVAYRVLQWAWDLNGNSMFYELLTNEFKSQCDIYEMDLNEYRRKRMM